MFKSKIKIAKVYVNSDDYSIKIELSNKVNLNTEKWKLMNRKVGLVLTGGKEKGLIK